MHGEQLHVQPHKLHQELHAPEVVAAVLEHDHPFEPGHTCNVGCDHYHADSHIDRPDEHDSHNHETGHVHSKGCGHVSHEDVHEHIEKPHDHTEHCGHIHHENVALHVDRHLKLTVAHSGHEHSSKHDHGPGCGHVHHEKAREHIDHAFQSVASLPEAAPTPKVEIKEQPVPEQVRQAVAVEKEPVAEPTIPTQEVALETAEVPPIAAEDEVAFDSEIVSTSRLANEVVAAEAMQGESGEVVEPLAMTTESATTTELVEPEADVPAPLSAVDEIAQPTETEQLMPEVAAISHTAPVELSQPETTPEQLPAELRTTSEKLLETLTGISEASELTIPAEVEEQLLSLGHYLPPAERLVLLTAMQHMEVEVLVSMIERLLEKSYAGLFRENAVLFSSGQPATDDANGVSLIGRLVLQLLRHTAGQPLIAMSRPKGLSYV